jgi:hypothetical protein
MAIDGTWRRDCQLNAISDNDAALTVEGSIQGLNLKEFFLLLSSTGTCLSPLRTGPRQRCRHGHQLPQGQAEQAAIRRRRRAGQELDSRGLTPAGYGNGL